MKKLIKATIMDLIVALLITAGLIAGLYLIYGRTIDTGLMLVNKITVDEENKPEEIVTIDIASKTLQTYPEYGTKYATIEIPRINVNLPVYFGDTLDVLKKGVGHSSGSYFPGEGGSIIYMGHNFEGYFRKFSELEIGDEITIKADYGEFKYEIYDMKLVNETDLDALPVQREKEILMVYTCYPFNNIGYATQRYVVYAKLEG